MKTLSKLACLSIQLTTILLIIVTLCSFDWPEKNNEQLRNDMLKYAESFSNDFKGTPLAKQIDRFLTAQKAKMEKEPYAWMGDTHRFVSELRKGFPPTTKNQEIRKHIFQLLDYPLHVNNYDQKIDTEEISAYNKASFDYITINKEKILNELETVRPTKGMVIWKVYNMGFIFRTLNHTIAIDMTSRPALFEHDQNGKTFVPESNRIWTDHDYQRLVKQIDILFVTHPHEDHYTLPLIREMLESGKPVVMPEFKNITQDSENLYILPESQETPKKIAGIDVLSFHGYQDKDIPCNVYLLDVDGIRIVDNGDNCNREIEKKLANYKPANIIIGSIWNDIQSFLTAAESASGSASANQLFIPAHENELQHSVGHRESYHEMFSRKDRLGNPDFQYPKTIFLDLGESIKYPFKK